MELLYQAAETWDRITKYQYEITYGYKKQLHTVTFSFSAEDFPHVAGFQYLNDVQIGRFSPKKMITKILDGELRQNQVEKALKYHSIIMPRLEAVKNLEIVLDGEFRLFSYRPEFLSFFSQIKADYLVSSIINGTTFVFLVRSGREENDFACCTAFIKGSRDYGSNQRAYTVLRKIKVDVMSGERTLLYKREGFEGV